VQTLIRNRLKKSAPFSPLPNTILQRLTVLYTYILSHRVATIFVETSLTSILKGAAHRNIPFSVAPK